MRAVIACVNFDDYLAVTLPAWQEVLGPDVHLVVVTAPDDLATKAVARANAVPVIETEAWYANGAAFNLAAGFNAAFAGVRQGEVCLALDADVLPVGVMPPASDIAAHTIYGVRRYEGPADELVLAPPANVPYIEERGRADSPEACAGYFQLFRYSPARSFGSYPTAATYDYEFAFSFPHGATLEGLTVTHLGERHRNWEGRVSPRMEAP